MPTGKAGLHPALPFDQVWFCDTEYRHDGGLPLPICLVAREYHSGREIRLFRDELLTLEEPPFDIGEHSLFVAYVASAELGCFLALGWPLPARVLDLAQEHKLSVNSGKAGKAAVGWGLVDAMRHRGLSHHMATEKPGIIQMILDTAVYTDVQRHTILDYCAEDTRCLEPLFEAMLPAIDLLQAVGLRGRYMKAVARMEHTGIPFDVECFDRIMDALPHIRPQMIRDADTFTRCYREDGSFSMALFEAFLKREGMDWERTDTGAPKLDGDTIRQRARYDPRLNDFHDLRSTLGLLHNLGSRDKSLKPSSDGRIRCPLWAFGSSTGRNQPKSSQFVFGTARWLRGLIKPKPGYALAYIDWSQQEFALAGGLSGDPAMIDDYQSGDVYWSFAQAAGRIPPGAVRKTGAGMSEEDHRHEAARDASKAIVLGLAYGKGCDAIARDAGLAAPLAKGLFDSHKRRYCQFWKWLDGVVHAATMHHSIGTKWGWRQIVTSATNPRTLQNFPMQAGGAHMMQLAAIKATEAGLRVCCPVHDAFLIEARAERIDDDVATMQAIMRECSVKVGGVPARTDAKVIPYPDRYMDKRGQSMWDKIITLTRNHSKCH